MCSFIELRTVDMFAIIKQWRVKGICKIEEGFSYYDKESKRRIHAGFSEVFNELKLAAYLHQNGVIEKLSRLGYTIRYNAYHEDENEWHMDFEHTPITNKIVPELENLHCRNCNFFERN